MMDHLTRWEEVELVTDYSAKKSAWFFFENIVTKFGCPKVLLSDHRTQILNKKIASLIEEFHIQHRKRTSYHLQENGTMEAFNKILENALTKVCNVG